MNEKDNQTINSFVFHPTFRDQARKLKSQDAQLALLWAIVEYGIDGTEPDFSAIDTMGFMDAIFSPIKFEIDRAKEKYRKMQATNRENGAKGGAPKGSRNNPQGRAKKSKANEELTGTNRELTGTNRELTETNRELTETNRELTETNRELTETNPNINRYKDIDNNNILSSPKVEDKIERVCKKTASAFLAPSRDEVLSFFSGNGLKSDGEAFFDYYESNGWKVGGKADMKNWQAAARNWDRREEKQGSGTSRGVYRANSSYEDARKRGEEEAAEFLLENIRNLGRDIPSTYNSPADLPF